MEITFEKFHQLIISDKFLVEYKGQDWLDAYKCSFKKNLLHQRLNGELVIYIDVDLVLLKEDNKQINFDEKISSCILYRRVYDEIETGGLEEFIGHDGYCSERLIKKRLGTYKLIPIEFIFYIRATKNDLFLNA
jgi:hypothetical protein